MNEPRRHLPGDLKALRYLDALNTGDLEAVARLWEAAADDPQLERMLTEIDEAMFQEIAGKPSSHSERLARPKAPLGRLERIGRHAGGRVFAGHSRLATSRHRKSGPDSCQ